MIPMEIALAEARVAAARGEVPVGAVVLDANGAVLARAGNEVEARHDASAHARRNDSSWFSFSSTQKKSVVSSTIAPKPIFRIS